MVRRTALLFAILLTSSAGAADLPAGGPSDRDLVTGALGPRAPLGYADDERGDCREAFLAVLFGSRCDLPDEAVFRPDRTVQDSDRGPGARRTVGTDVSAVPEPDAPEPAAPAATPKPSGKSPTAAKEPESSQTGDAGADKDKHAKTSRKDTSKGSGKMTSSGSKH